MLLFVTEKGFCLRGNLCPFDHGSDPLIFDDENIPGIVTFPGKTVQQIEFEAHMWEWPALLIAWTLFGNDMVELDIIRKLQAYPERSTS